MGRWCLSCSAFGGMWRRRVVSDFQYQVHKDIFWDVWHPSWSLAINLFSMCLRHPLLLLSDLFSNLALSIPSVSSLRPWETLQGCRSTCFFKCKPASLLPELFPASRCRFSSFEICKSIRILLGLFSSWFVGNFSPSEGSLCLVVVPHKYIYIYFKMPKTLSLSLGCVCFSVKTCQEYPC